MSEIKKAAVIGAGVMGAGIAAHIANAGVPVVLLDIVPKDGDNRNAIAEGAVAKMLKTEPASFMTKRAAKLVTTGNIEDHMDLLADCDWIVEAVIERLDIKQDLYAKIDAVRKAGSVVSSNTSTIPLKNLKDGMADGMKPDFIITHFFNPPRYMRLLEIVSDNGNRKEGVDMVEAFADVGLGKNVVHCNDTPGFIANRIGNYWIQLGVQNAIEMGLTVEEADAIGSRPFGIPKTGFFGLVDLVGLDLMPHVVASMLENLPEGDDFRRIFYQPDIITTMLEKGMTGRKSKTGGGFYRLNREGGKKVKESLNLTTGEYGPSVKADLKSVKAAKKGPRAMLEAGDKGSEFAWSLVSQALVYAASLVPEIADDVVAVDGAMRDGYGWKFGPFQIIDQIGPKWLADKLTEEGKEVPAFLTQVGDGTFYRVENGTLQFFGTDGGYHDVVRPDGVLLLSDIKLRSEPVLKNGSASVWDIGDGVLCFEFTSKMNSLDPQIMDAYKKTKKLIDKSDDYKALVIHNEGSNFSVGANLGLFIFAANIAMWPEIESQIADGQKTYMSLKYADFPVVSAPSGMALGGGCEILLHSDAVQAHAETYTGLVEVGVGFVPGWGGCKEMVIRHSEKKFPNGPIAPIAKAFEQIGTGQVAKSAAEAMQMGIFRKSDGITMNRDRLLADAKAKALALAENYTPPEEPELRLPGKNGMAPLKLALKEMAKKGIATPHDMVVAEGLGRVLTGGDTDVVDVVSEKDLLKLEREVFLALAKTEGTMARVEHMLDTGKPLRN